MSKKAKKIICLLIACALILLNVGIETRAAGGLSISTSATQVSSGGTFTVTVKAASNYFVSNIKLSVSGGTVVSGLGVTSLDKGEAKTATIKLTGDTCVVSVSGVGANYDTETEGTASASVSVKKKASTNSNSSNNNSNNNTVTNTKSKDNTLSSITISEGALTPTFNANTTEYTVAVSGTTEKITLGAKANHTKASISGTGEKQLVPGHNNFTIVCTAENGSKKEYKVDVYVDETPQVYLNYNGQNLGVVRNQTNIGIPTTFEATTVSISGQAVQAYYSSQMDMTLLYLVNESEGKNFYIYEQNIGITSVFRPVSILGRNVIVYDLTEEEQVRKNMAFSEVTIDGTTLYGWTYENPDFANYVHILVMNELGEKVVYQYEKTENSLQLYKEYVEVEETVEEPVEKTWFPNEYYMYAIAGLGALSLILLIAMIYFIASRKARHEGRKKKAIKRQEKQRAKEERQREKEARELEKHRQILEEEREKQRQIEEKKMAKKLAKQKKREE